MPLHDRVANASLADAEAESRKLLLIEDDPIDEQRINRWLRAMSQPRWDVISVSTLADGLDVLALEAIDIALIDLTLPDASGLEAVGAVLAAASDTAVVVQTGLDDEKTPLEALELGAQDYLDKDTMTREALQRAVRHAITRHALGKTAATLAATDAELDDFAHVVAHDLRAPVRTARLLADRVVTLAESENPMVSDLGERLDDALYRVDSMILSMLDYSALRGATPDMAVIGLDEAVREATATIEADLIGADARVSVDVPSDLTVAANGDLLQRVLINLMMNAIKYSRPDEASSISVTAQHHDSTIRMQVADNGVGVPPADRERVFRLLERLDHSSTGLGFGLAICRRAMDQFSGRIWIEPSEPPGTTVTLEFPATARPAAG